MGELQKIFVLCFIIYCANCQENAGTNVAPALQECYNTTRYATKDYLLPSTINVLVELIRKAEDGNPNLDAREIAVSLLHRFRQDGIRKTWKDMDSRQILPYSPKGFEAYKNRIQLIKITPGNAVNFNNDSLSHLQACSLHSIISSTIELKVRGDENAVCQKSGRYISRIQKRQITELSDTDGKSSCPIESGVIYTKWGAVKAGLLIGGIAAGFQSNPISTDYGTVETVYASTIAGELAEAAIYQPDSKVVGNSGFWNNTVQPKYYFLGSNDFYKTLLTDAEIRGGLDGLFMGLSINSWQSKSSKIKVSQILDLYYSRGVFNASARACNRIALTQDLISGNKLQNQSLSFSKILDDVSQLTYTIPDATAVDMAQTITDAFRSYVSSYIKDLECSAEEDLYERVSTDVLIFIDTAWEYNIIQPLVSYILESIDINNYESSYTIFDGANCNTIVNKSRSILDFYEYYNLTQQQLYPTGFDYTKVMQTVESVYREKLNNETDLTGQSTIVLMFPHTTPTTSQSEYVQSKRSDFKSTLPDVRILVGGPGSSSSYYNLVTSTTSDIITVDDNISESQIKEAGQVFINRLKKLPRNVVNPLCGSSFTTDGAKSFEVTQYVEPLGINYHKISPNYFYGGQTLKIQGKGYGTLLVCTSRTDANPKNASDTTCNSITSDEVTIDISGYCDDQNVIDCNPIYISVEGKISTTVRCSENTCRFPDNIKYTINLENVQCSSSSQTVVASFMIVSLLFAILKF